MMKKTHTTAVLFPQRGAMRWYKWYMTDQARRISLFIVIIVLLVGCKKTDEGKSDAAIGSPVVVGAPQYKALTEYLELNASTTFLKKEIVRATFQGYIRKTYKDVGDHVDEGEPLFLLKTKEAAANDSARIDLGGVRFSGEIQIRAKSTGVLAQKNFNTGDYVNDGEQLAVVSNPSSLRIVLNVPYQNVVAIRLNSSCVIVLPDNATCAGVIRRRIPSVDVNAQTQSFLIELSSKISLPENLNLVVKIPGRVYAAATVLPKSAVMSSEVMDEFWVMKLISDTSAVRVAVKKGIEDGDFVQILSPVFSGNDRIVVQGAYGLPDTARVVIRK
jgi:hypothetical protein